MISNLVTVIMVFDKSVPIPLRSMVRDSKSGAPQISWRAECTGGPGLESSARSKSRRLHYLIKSTSPISPLLFTQRVQRSQRLRHIRWISSCLTSQCHLPVAFHIQATAQIQIHTREAYPEARQHMKRRIIIRAHSWTSNGAVKSRRKYYPSYTNFYQLLFSYVYKLCGAILALFMTAGSESIQIVILLSSWLPDTCNVRGGAYNIE